MYFYIGRTICAFFIYLFGRLRVTGREQIPRAGGVLLASNHTSYMDPPLVGVATHIRPVWFMAKSELFDIPVLGPIIRGVHAFPVKRGTADRQALRYAHELLTTGKALTVFIEGGRSHDGRLMEPELGVAMMAVKAGVPIVPVALIDADKLLPPRAKFFKFSRVRVAFGEPVETAHLAGKHTDRQTLMTVSETVMRRIAALMHEHGASERVPDGYLERTVDA